MSGKATRCAVGAALASVRVGSSRARKGMSTRAFSTSPSRQRSLVSFTPTSSPELDATLKTIRAKIILPMSLPAAQRKQITSPKHMHRLKSDPVTLNIDGEEYKFGHIDLFTGFPNTRNIFFQAVNDMKTPGDFANLPRLLEGLHSVGRTFRTLHYSKMIRRAGYNGCILTIISAARMSRRTGLCLDNSQKANGVLSYVQQMAIDADFAEKETERALKWSETVVDLLEEENHQRKAKQSGPTDGPRCLPLNRDPQILAARLHMAAALAVKHRGAVDGDGKVEKYARELVSLWPAETGLHGLHPEGAFAEKQEMFYLVHPSKFVVMVAPLLHGLGMAMQVVDADLAAELKSRHDALAKEVEERLPDVTSDRAHYIYGKLYKPLKPDWAGGYTPTKAIGESPEAEEAV